MCTMASNISIPHTFLKFIKYSFLSNFSSIGCFTTERVWVFWYTMVFDDLRLLSAFIKNNYILTADPSKYTRPSFSAKADPALGLTTLRSTKSVLFPNRTPGVVEAALSGIELCTRATHWLTEFSDNSDVTSNTTIKMFTSHHWKC